MFSMKRTFRKPLAVCFFLAFAWILLLHENDYEDETVEKDQSHFSNVRGNGVSPEEMRHHDEVEDIIFGQGILITRSNGDRASQNQNDLLLHHDKDTVLAQDHPVRYGNAIEDSQAGPHRSLETASKNANFQDESTIRDYYKIQPTWMRVTDDIYTYSGFWDSRQELVRGPVARVLGVIRYRKGILEDAAAFRWNGYIKEEALNCSCLLWYEGQREPQQGNLKAFCFEEGREMFAGTYFLCYPWRNANGSHHVESKTSKLQGKNSVPYAVSLHPDNTVNAPHKLIYLNHNNPKGDTKNSTAVCVRALFGPYDDVRGMAQFVSYYNTVLKISNFIFYDLAIDPTVTRFIESLRTLLGLSFEILPWNLPTSEWGELWDVGSLTALNDCVYRSSGKHSLVAIVDLDEFIVPRNRVNSLPDLYHKVLTFRKGNHGDAVLMLNVFYCYDFKESSLDTKTNNSLPIFTYKHREAHSWPPKSRSKILVTPETVVSVGHHMVHNFLTKTLENRSSSKLFSILHHYRMCADLRSGIHGTGNKVLNGETVRDTSMFQYKSAVMKSEIMKIYMNFST